MPTSVADRANTGAVCHSPWLRWKTRRSAAVWDYAARLDAPLEARGLGKGSPDDLHARGGSHCTGPLGATCHTHATSARSHCRPQEGGPGHSGSPLPSFSSFHFWTTHTPDAGFARASKASNPGASTGPAF